MTPVEPGGANPQRLGSLAVAPELTVREAS